MAHIGITLKVKLIFLLYTSFLQCDDESKTKRFCLENGPLYPISGLLPNW